MLILPPVLFTIILLKAREWVQDLALHGKPHARESLRHSRRIVRGRLAGMVGSLLPIPNCLFTQNFHRGFQLHRKSTKIHKIRPEDRGTTGEF